VGSRVVSCARCAAFVFDLDGCVWTGDVLVPGAAEVLALPPRTGPRVSFLTNNSAARSATMQAKLERLGVQAALPEVLTPLEILGEVIDARWGPSRVLVIGTELLGSTLAESGHTLVPGRAIPRGPSGGCRS